MKVTCNISGLQFDSLGFGQVSLQADHPIFSLPYTELLILSDSWKSGHLNESETHLFTLALARASTLFSVSSEASCSPEYLSQQVCETAIPQLLDLLDFISDSCRSLNLSDYFPSFVIRDSEDIAGLLSWITDCKESVRTYFSERAALRAASDKASGRALVKRLCNKSESNPELFGRRLAAWASVATDFPSTKLNIESVQAQHGHVTLAEFWKYIIECAATRQKDSRIYTIYKADMLELQDWLIEHLDISINESWTLLELLKATILEQDFFSDSHFDIVIRDNSNSELLAKELLSEPKKSDFVTSLEYWQAVALYGSQQKALAALADKGDN